MPALMIAIVDGKWVAQVANTPVKYAFAGDTLELQSWRVADMAFAMENEETAAMIQFFANPGVANNVLVGQLFGSTDTIVYGGEVVYATVDDFLLSELEEAGTALAAVL